MKVVLIQPPQSGLKDPLGFPPLGLLYIAASLERNGVEVEVVNLADRQPGEGLTLDLPPASHYGITVTLANYVCVKGMVQELRGHSPQAKVILGGPYCTALPQETYDDAAPDWVVDGEGEYAVLDILSGIPEGVVIAPRISNLDKLPFPARHLLHYDSVFNGYMHKTRIGHGTTILTSRGCPFKCAFCSKNRIMAGRPFYHSAEYVANELDYIASTWGVKCFRIIDDLFCCDKERILHLCDLIEDRGYSFYSTARADYMQDVGFLRRLKECGMHCISIGVESGSNDILKRINKGEKIETILKAFQNCAAVGIKTHAMLIFGLPGETLSTLEETKAFMRAAKPDSYIASTFTPLPGSPIWAHPEKYGVTIDKSKATGWFFDTDEAPAFLPQEVQDARAGFFAWLKEGAWRS